MEPWQFEEQERARYEQVARRLVRSVLRDRPSDREDMVQEAWLRAIERGPRGGLALLRWMGRATVNRAHSLRRTESRSRHRERRAAVPEALHSTLDEVARQEVVRRVGAAVLGLEEPSRACILMRYYDELPPRAIAKRLGLPVATVKSRLRRGLARLRIRLEAECGIAQLWSFALGVRAGLGTAPGVARRLGWNSAAKSSAVAGAVLSAAVWLSIDPTADPLPYPSSPRGEFAEASPAPTNEPVSLSRSAVAAQGSMTVRVQCQDETGAPLASAEVRWQCWARGLNERRFLGEDGRLEIRLSDALDGQAMELQLSVSKVGHRSAGRAVFVEPGEEVDLGVWRVEHCIPVSGRVEDEWGGVVGGAALVAEEVQGTRAAVAPRTSRHDGVADPEGRFEIGVAGPGTWRLWAFDSEHGWCCSESFVVEDERTPDPVLVVMRPAPPKDQAPVLRGRVLPSTRRAAPPAVFLYPSGTEPDLDHFVRTEWDGSFSIEVDPKLRYDLFAQSGADDGTVATAVGVVAGDVLELQLGRPTELKLVVKDEAGDPVPSFDAYCIRPRTDRMFALPARIGSSLNAIVLPSVMEYLDEGPYSSRTESPLGEGSIPVPDEDFSVRLLAPGFESVRLGPFDRSTLPESVGVELRRLSRVRGRVIGDGARVEGAEVSLFERIDPDCSLCFGDLRSLTVLEPSATVRSEPDGSFELPCFHPGSYVLRVEAEGYAPSELGPFELEVLEEDHEVEVELGPGGSIEGRVLMAEGLDPKGLLVGITRGDSRPRTFRLPADGRFRFDGLAPGRYEVRESGFEIQGGHAGKSGCAFLNPWSFLDETPHSHARPPRPFDFTVEVREGETTTVELDWSREYRVVGSLCLDGERVPVGVFLIPDGVTVMALPWRDCIAGTKERDFEVAVGTSGLHRLDLYVPGTNLHVQRDLVLEAPRERCDFEFDTARVAIARDQIRAEPWARLTVEVLGSGGTTIRLAERPGPEGPIEFALVPAGSCRLRWEDPAGEPRVVETWLEAGSVFEIGEDR